MDVDDRVQIELHRCYWGGKPGAEISIDNHRAKVRFGHPSVAQTDDWEYELLLCGLRTPWPVPRTIEADL